MKSFYFSFFISTIKKISFKLPCMTELSFPYNGEILVFFNNFLQEDFWQNFVFIFADGPVFFMPLFLVAAWLYFTYKKQSKNKKIDLLNIFYSSLIALIGNVVFQMFFNFERPEELCKQTGNLIIEHIPDASFPSDHAAMSFAFLTAVYLAGYKKIAGGLFVAFSLMNISRIMACVHWPYDILVGVIFGIIVASISYKSLSKSVFIRKINLGIIHILSKIKL